MNNGNYKVRNLIGSIPASMLMVIDIIMFLFFWYDKNIEGMFICGLLFTLLEVIQKSRDFYKNIAFILFLLSFFIFLQGRYLVNIILTNRMLSEFSNDIAIHINICIMLSLICLHVGYTMSSRFRIKNYSPVSLNENNIDRMNEAVSKRCLFLFYSSSFIAALAQIDIIIFVQNYSYVDYYLSYSSHIPRLLQVFGNMYIVFFVFYLCTFQNKEQCKKPILVFVLLSILVLLTGDRGGMIQNISMLVVYCLWRQKLENIIWIKPKTILFGLILSPFVMALLSYYVYFREGLDVGAPTLSEQLKRFLLISGRSANVLGYSIEYKDWFPQKYYTFGGIIDYIKFNPISSSLFGFVKPSPQTVEYAMTMHSFDSTLSYFVYPQTYFNGHGIGSSFLAETYYDFGYLGIVIISIIYAILFDKCYSFNSGSIEKCAISLLIIRGLFYAPRGPALIFITNILNITTLGAFFLYYVVCKNQFRALIR